MGEVVGEREVENEARAARPEQTRREFHDDTGQLWTVRESVIPLAEWTPSDEQADLAGYGVGWLWFHSGSRLRRRRLYPKRWRLLGDADLARLCELAREVAAPRQSPD